MPIAEAGIGPICSAPPVAATGTAGSIAPVKMLPGHFARSSVSKASVSSTCSLIVIVSDCVAGYAGHIASVAVTANADAPTTVGVPLMTPVDDNTRPAGSEPLAIVHVVAPTLPTAISVAEY